jgi:hypothetical protein
LVWLLVSRGFAGIIPCRCCSRKPPLVPQAVWGPFKESPVVWYLMGKNYTRRWYLMVFARVGLLF